MKDLAFAIIAFLLAAPADGELIWLKLKIAKDGAGWRYSASDGDARNFASDKELRDYLKGLSNIGDSIYLTTESPGDVSTGELINVLEMTKANPQGIIVKRINLDTDHSGSTQTGASTRPAR